MPIPLGPILAQVVTLAVGDRNEVRFIAAPAQHYEAAVTPTVGARSAWRHLTLTVGYGAGFALVPLDSKPRSLTLFHSAYVSATYTWQRTALTVAQSGGYGTLNFATQALAGTGTLGTGVPVPDLGNAGAGGQAPAASAPLPVGTVVGAGGAPVGAGTPGTGAVAPNQVRALNRVIHYGTETTSVGVAHLLTPTLRLGGEAAYSISGSTRESDRLEYPTVRGPRFGALLGYRMDPRNDLTSTATVQYSSSTFGTHAWLGTLTEGLTHRFELRTSGTVSAGISVARSPAGNGFVQWSVYPTAGLGLSTVQPIRHGALTLSATAATAPALDPIAQVVDPRLAFGVGAGFAQERFFSSLTASSALSLDGKENDGALRAVSGGATVGYQLATAVSADAGVRAAYQFYQGDTVIPLTYGVFIGLTLGAATTLK